MIDLDEQAYCLVYPDVAAAVAAGDFPTASDRYRLYGHTEIESGGRLSPFLLTCGPDLALPVIVTLLSRATMDRAQPWSFLNPLEQCLVQDFATELFGPIYAAYVSDLPESMSGFQHWLQYGKQEALDGHRTFSHGVAVPSRGRGVAVAPYLLRLFVAVSDWGELLTSCAHGVECRPLASRTAEQVPGIVAYRAHAEARTVPDTLHVHSHLQSGADHSYGGSPRIVAFYLPQYHAIPENDAWWGPGFTEWTNVRKATPNFEGHRQPHVPLNEDYYDLTDLAVQRRQSALAKEYGIAAFCYYLYWFDGRRVLERPLDQLLADSSIDHEFCVCWANENWTRTWDGNAKDILLQQNHTPDSDRRFIRDAMKYLADPRYLRVAGKLALLVYRVDLLTDARATAAIWREEVRRAGLGELHLCAVQFYGVTDPEPWGFDAAVEFPPHGWLVEENLPSVPTAIENPEFEGMILDYGKSVQWALSKPHPDYTWYRGIFPGWDNTARRQNTPHIFADSSPMAFQAWLTEILRQTLIMAPVEHQLVFVNAWNEWGEGAHLEPDDQDGHLNLMAVNSALSTARQQAWPLGVLARLRRAGDYPGRTIDERALLDLLRSSENAMGALTAQLRATGINPFL